MTDIIECAADESTNVELYQLTDNMVKGFAEEALSLLGEAEAALLKVENDLEEQLTVALLAFHSLKGNAGFYGYRDIEKLCHSIEGVLEVLKNGTAEKDSVEAHIAKVLSVIDMLVHCVFLVASGGGKSINDLNDYIADLNQLHQCLLSSNKVFCEEKKERICLPATEITVVEKAADIAVQEPDKESVQSKPKIVIALDEGEELKSPATPAKEDTEKKNNLKTAAAQVIRVETEKIDRLLDLVGELVIAEAMVLQRSNLQKILAGKVDKSVTHLKKITRDIQDISMSMRMVPLSATFQKMLRVVRDLSLKSGKKINLTIVGEDTEVDKSITEQISDPLLHIIRNSIDHGVENSQRRLELGKPEEGQIRLEAKHVAGEVWIVVKDDGKGLERDRILLKAIEAGLVKDKNREYTDAEIYKFIFEPGFSTAEKVTEISGRGVGMDVVRKQLELLRGKIEIMSEPNKGTTIILKIPLTLAIIEGMMMVVGKASYTVPIGVICECFRPKLKQVVMTPEGMEVVNIRGVLLPVVRLHEVYHINTECVNLTEGIVVVVESDKGKYGLFVDGILGQQQIVIKHLPEYLGEIKGISGMAIMGSGEMSMILDVSVLIRSVEKLIARQESFQERSDR